MEDKKINGYITRDGEYVPLDDLEGMERSLTSLYKGDMNGVSYGLREVALELAKEHDDVSARRFLARAQRIGGGTPKEGAVMAQLGVKFENIERYDFAIECYEYGKSLGRGEDFIWYFLHNNHAYCLAMLERFAEAEVQAREAIKIKPGPHNAHKNLGLALMGLGRFREAVDSFRRARDLGPNDRRVAEYLAVAEERLECESTRSLN